MFTDVRRVLARGHGLCPESTISGWNNARSCCSFNFLAIRHLSSSPGSLAAEPDMPVENGAPVRVPVEDEYFYNGTTVSITHAPRLFAQ
jgi:hypothetical protein